MHSSVIIIAIKYNSKIQKKFNKECNEKKLFKNSTRSVMKKIIQKFKKFNKECNEKSTNQQDEARQLTFF
jgi:hypothetical protein